MSVHNIRKETMKAGDVYIGRPGHGQDGYFGNPFVLGTGEARGGTIERFRDYAQDRMFRDPAYRERVKGLCNKRLFCFCAPHPCHGDVLSMLAVQEWLVEKGVRKGRQVMTEEGLLTITGIKGSEVWFKDDVCEYSIHGEEWDECMHIFIEDWKEPAEPVHPGQLSFL